MTPDNDRYSVSEQPRQPSGTYTPAIIEDIQVKAELGRYRIRGFGNLRPRTWATFDDLTFVPAGLTRIPSEPWVMTASCSSISCTMNVKPSVAIAR